MEDGHLGVFETVGLVLFSDFCYCGHGSSTVVRITMLVVLIGSVLTVWTGGLCALRAVRCVVTATVADVASNMG